jgi:hypothetical protein
MRRERGLGAEFSMQYEGQRSPARHRLGRKKT